MSDSYTLYNKTVMDHFLNPRNLGDLNDADAIGEVGAAACGDIMKISLKIDKETNIITDARFKTFGCGSAIAASSMATELIKGRTIDDLKNNFDIELFVEEQEAIPNTDQTRTILKQLNFKKDNIAILNGILLDEPLTFDIEENYFCFESKVLVML